MRVRPRHGDRGHIPPEPVLDTVHGEDTTTVVLGGDLDLVSIAPVRRVLEQECARGPATLVVDLARVEFLDSSALHLLVATQRRLRDDGRALVLLSPSEATLRVFTMSGLDREFVFDGHEHTPARA